MILIVDSNIIISALIKNSITREIIVKADQRFLMPEIVIEEVREHKNIILKKSGIDEQKYNKLLEKLLSYIELIPDEAVERNLKEAIKIMKDIDKNDAVFIAAALSYSGSRIWSDDRHFEKQNKVKILKTSDLIFLFKDSKTL